MAIDFPASPVNGQVFTDGNHTWVYSSTLPGWKLQAQTVVGPTGPTGPTGQGVPIGGTQYQFLIKNSSTNYDTVWSGIIDGGTP